LSSPIHEIAYYVAPPGREYFPAGRLSWWLTRCFAPARTGNARSRFDHTFAEKASIPVIFFCDASATERQQSCTRFAGRRFNVVRSLPRCRTCNLLNRGGRSVWIRDAVPVVQTLQHKTSWFSAGNSVSRQMTMNRPGRSERAGRPAGQPNDVRLEVSTAHYVPVGWPFTQRGHNESFSALGLRRWVILCLGARCSWPARNVLFCGVVPATILRPSAPAFRPHQKF